MVVLPLGARGRLDKKVVLHFIDNQYFMIYPLEWDIPVIQFSG